MNAMNEVTLRRVLAIIALILAVAALVAPGPQTWLTVAVVVLAVALLL